MLAIEALKRLYTIETEDTMQTNENNDIKEELLSMRKAELENMPVQQVSAAEVPEQPKKAAEEAKPFEQPNQQHPSDSCTGTLTVPGRVNIIGSRDPGYSAALQQLACDLAKNMKFFKPLLNELIRACDSESRRFRYDLGCMDPVDRNAAVALTKRLTGFINRFTYDRTTCVISGYVGAVPMIAQFFKGGYLELALKSLSERIVREYAERTGAEYRVLANAIVSDGRFNNEFDVYIRLGAEEYLIEAKAGKAAFVDYDKYYQIGLRYHIVPEHLLLVCSDLSEESAGIIHDDLYHYYVTSAENFENSLRSMIERKGERK